MPGLAWESGAGPGDVRRGRGLPGLCSWQSACPAALPRVSCSRGSSDWVARPSRTFWSAPAPLARPPVLSPACAPPSLHAAARPPSRPRTVHAAAIPPNAMARALQDGSRAEPTAAVSGSPAFPLGGTVALPPPVCRTPLALPPGLNCALCPGGGPLPRALYRCIRGQEPPRSRSSEARGNVTAAAESSQRQEPPSNRLQGAALPNGHIPRSPPSLEQALGARLRYMGDQFQRDHEQRQRRQQRRQQHRPVWDHFYHFLFQLLGLFYNLPVEGVVGLGLN